MNVFWLYALGPMLLAACFILYPFRRAVRGDVSGVFDEQGVRSLEIHRQRLADLEQAFGEGEIDREAYTVQVEEAQRVLLEDEETAHQQDAIETERLPGGLSDRSIGIISTGILLLLSWAWFSDSGLSQGAIAELNLTAQVLESREIPQSKERLLALIVTVEDVRRVSPSNEQLEFYLGQLRLAVGDFAEAVAIFEGLARRYPDGGEILGYLAQARYLQQNQTMTDDLEALFQRAVVLSPQNVGLLEILGIEAFKSGDAFAAKQWFLQALPHAGDERAQLIETLLKDLGSARSERPSAGGGTEGDARQAVGSDSAKTGAVPRQIIVKVAVAAGTDIPKGARLFVFARALKGPPMPLAVATRDAVDLPVEVTLDESMAMMPGLSLADFDQVEVVARISASGDAIASPGDIEVSSATIALTEGSVRVDLVLVSGP